MLIKMDRFGPPESMELVTQLKSSVSNLYLWSCEIIWKFVDRISLWRFILTIHNPDNIRSLRWSHNERDGVSNHQRIDCLFSRLFRRRKINMKAPRHWPLCEEFTGDRWIPRIKGHYRGKCSHLMTSSWHHHRSSQDGWRDFLSWLDEIIISNQVPCWMLPSNNGISFMIWDSHMRCGISS